MTTATTTLALASKNQLPFAVIGEVLGPFRVNGDIRESTVKSKYEFLISAFRPDISESPAAFPLDAA